MQELYFRELGEGKPLIILHGLLGTSDNWLTLGKKYAEHFKVYILDQRNHGQSFHDDEFSYPAMAEDLLNFMNNHNIEKAHILGHSMGGKVAMTFATEHPNRVDKLIVADIGPQSYPPHHTLIFKGLFSLDLPNLSSRKEADEKLAEYIPEFGVRQFLLKNLARNNDAFEWKMNLDVIAKEIDKVGLGLNHNAEYKGTTLFVRGGKSDYIQDSDFNLIHSIFKKSKIETIEGVGHWLHAEKPEEFLNLTLDYLQNG
ncbi:alpha/beta hydrolase [Roseivirga seohaensis subsp. aquiponti]|uniref:Alpha/beta hydrolase n=1 Tax=Roseivirga seohaensis subsp. aquiponti TaxID=1566026 RepID=A0A0L8AP11_9BACT|nr:alpha/beta fold hydrolase [Roseivirga seohaensis]KOF04054.1 alpha/beta hydrolase [Roseivirga seohaensis subsp. aquiponti]